MNMSENKSATVNVCLDSQLGVAVSVSPLREEARGQLDSLGFGVSRWPSCDACLCQGMHMPNQLLE